MLQSSFVLLLILCLGTFSACKKKEESKKTIINEQKPAAVVAEKPVTAEMDSVPENANFEVGTPTGYSYYSGYYTGSWSPNWKNTENPVHERELEELATYNVNLIIPYSTGLYDHRPELLADPTYIADHYLRVDRYLEKANNLGMKVILQVWNSPHGIEPGPNGLSINSSNYIQSGPTGTIANLKNLVNRYKNHPAIIGWYVIDEPILSIEKANNPVQQYTTVTNALAAVTTAIREVDDTNKFIFGVLARYHDGHTIASLQGKPAELIVNYLDVWGQDQYPFAKTHTRDLQNILSLQIGLHRLEGYNFNLKEVHGKELPFIFVNQAQGFQAPGEGGLGQRLPTIRESIFQKLYGAMVLTDRRQASYLGDVSWAYYATKRSLSAEEGGWPGIPYKRSGVDWLSDVYVRVKNVMDHMLPVLKSSIVVKKWRIDRTNPSENEYSKDILASLYKVPEDAILFVDKVIQPHPFRGKYVFLAFNANLQNKNFTFDLSHDGKTTIKNLSLFEASGQSQVSIREGIRLDTVLPAVYPLIAVFDVD